MTLRPTATRQDWLAARTALLEAEKAHTRNRDRLAQMRRDMPRMLVDKTYRFEGAAGPVTLSDLFAGRGQLLVQHFMFGADWRAPCPSCSLMGDHVDGARQHFEQRDLSFAAVSRAPVDKLEAARRRLGWKFQWVSSADTDFNTDFDVAHDVDAVAAGAAVYNYRRFDGSMVELPGVSVFQKDADGAIYHTYSTYGRGLEPFIGAYEFLDLAPLGRGEDKRSGPPMSWVRLHDEYPA